MRGKLFVGLGVLTAGLLAAPVAAAAPADDVRVAGIAVRTPLGPELTTVDPGCATTVYGLSAWRINKTYTWYYNPSGAPASVASTALAAITSGSQTVADGRNRCGITSRPDTLQRYAGTTTKKPGVSADKACPTNDGVSTIGWGALPSNTLGYTCVFYRPNNGQVIAADVMLNNSSGIDWATTKPASCTRTYDLESVVVHERGHTEGLDHVDQSKYPEQTMSPSTKPCDTTKRLLGSGDVAGLLALYGVA